MRKPQIFLISFVCVFDYQLNSYANPKESLVKSLNGGGDGVAKDGRRVVDTQPGEDTNEIPSVASGIGKHFQLQY